MYEKSKVSQYVPDKKGRGLEGFFKKTLLSLDVGEEFSLSNLSKGQTKSKSVASSVIGKSSSRKFSTKTFSEKEDAFIMSFRRIE